MAILLLHHPSLANMLKKNKPWKWDARCQNAFEALKKAVMEESMLALPNYSKSFEIHMDASDFAISGVLLQDWHPVAYKS